ncbi:MAG: hypothetical protein ABIQ31_05970 [Ferruginibacter sp.]
MKFSGSLFFLAMLITINGCSQGNADKRETNGSKGARVGGGCEGCEAIYESPVPFEKLKPVDTLPDYYEAGPKIGISGIVYQPDGRTPAKDVVIYIYHTDQKGIYANRNSDTGWAKRHGYIRGWVKTDQHGFYQFFTLVPASYPNSKNPKHIHPVIRETDKNEYYIDEFVFDDDPFLAETLRNPGSPRGGSGVLKPTKKDGIFRATRHIILGKNIPGYPITKAETIQSGLAIGSNCPAFEPFHLSGPDKGKSVCPMCKYGYGKGVMIWFNHANLDQLKNFAVKLENEMEHRGEKEFRVFLIYMNPFYKENDATGSKILQGKLARWCEENGLKKVAFVWVPSPVDEESCGIYKINKQAKNTVLVYKKRTVVANLADIDYDDEAMHTILEKIDSPI